ncbi:Uncharacterized protein OS=Pseudomonas alcaligenes OT 69 GN=L682_26355 PE=4 SV=1 [Gemmata massiliana]|uniref:Uncharacterized protein n=1 Tax=Gemmata massiliana TaxID=1210884 RepID=A0A6P2DDI2_9BACT|nr:hypothetical protein [Gemmata massiliana]VTR98425.1 Uncharacterized protein OS=Pseudomonas alcaligenes OT 69 GN=L682_26355 PE=4 SV=1 [Gemmata massiliana]
MNVRGFPWGGLVVATVLLSGCGKGAPRGDAPAAADAPAPVLPPPEQLVVIPGDTSLTPEEYIKLGMPAHDRAWTGPEMNKASTVLAKFEKDLGKLPRYNSSRSGKVFSRIASTENFASSKNLALPLNMRFPNTLNYFGAMNTIFKTYLSADPRAATLGAEQLELMGTLMRSAVAMCYLCDELVPTLDPKDPTYPARMRGLETMRGGLATMVSGGLISLTEAHYTEADRLRLLGSLEETLPVLFTHLTDGSKVEIPVRLSELEADPKLAFAKDRLRALREKLPTK